MVYIVDDDQNVRDGFMMLLQSAGFKSNSFESAEKFLEHYEQNHNHDLLILDISLGGMSGCDLMEYLTKRDLHLPVIIITAFDAEAYSQGCKKLWSFSILA